MKKITHTFKPSPDLQPYIKKYWVLEQPEAGARPIRIKILPHGHPEFVFHYGAPFRLHRGAEAALMPRVLVRGQLKKHVELESTGRVGAFGVCFRPSGLYSLMGLPPRHLTDQALDLEEVFGALVAELSRQVLAAAGTARRIGLVESFFRQRLAGGGEEVVYAPHAVEYIHRNGGKVSVADVCRRMGIGERQVEREFKEKIGLSPKFFIRISRLTNSLRVIQEHLEIGWARLAYECGYADQAHLINEFRAFAGETPRQFFARPAVLPEESACFL